MGATTKRTALQLLHAACALEQELETQDLRAVWLAANDFEYPGKKMQPVLTRWSYVRECLVKSLDNMKVCMKFATKIKDLYKAGNSKGDISSDFLSLVREDVLVSMAWFLLGFHNRF